MIIDKYIKQLASLEFFGSLEESKRLELFDKLVQVFIKRLLSKSAEILSDEQLDEIENLVKEKGDEAVLEYMETHVSQFESFAKQEMSDLIAHTEAVMNVEI